MKAESENAQRLDDIIFENRNKEYGAYAIRKSYDDNVITGWTISLGVVSLVFLCSFLSMEKSIVRPSAPPNTTDPSLPPIIKVNPKDPVTPPAPKQLKKDLFPIATTKADTPDEPVEPTKPENPGGPDGTGTTGDDVSQSGASNFGNGTLPEPPKPPYVLIAEHMPAYEGGTEAMMKFLQKKTHYPATAKRKKDEGTVYVSFIISTTGAVTNVEVIKGVSKECDEEAVRVISMMNKWSPGLQNQMPVAVKLVLPIKFKLDSTS